MAMGYDADVVHTEKDSSHSANSQELVARIFTWREKDPLMDIEGIIERLRLAHGAKNDTQLAQALGLAKSAASNWRSRNTVPVDMCFETACNKGVSMDWLIFGVGDMRLGMRGYEPSASAPDSGQSAPGPAVERLARFMYWWYVNRSPDDMAWLETQFRRGVPEYGEWLANPANVAKR